jgi:hypothetical protein
VNSWNSNYEKPLYTITNGSKSQTSTISNLAVNPALQTFSLYLDKTSPKLKYSIATSGSSSNTVVTITDNFPIQRWCYVAISVDGTVVDAYLDGKLVLSKQLSSAPTTNINLASSAIVIGDSVAKHDTYVGLANRLEYATTPEAVWKSYLATAGSMSISSVYNLKLSLLQNNSETNSYKLW